MVFYRKYRPQKIDDLDSAYVRETLKSVFEDQNFPHAFLFTGPKGLGKTSTARIIAKVINCEKINDYSIKKATSNKQQAASKLNTSIEPCNKCDQCVSITNGSNIDILEIDGASNRGIDEIRDLKEKIKLSPAKSLKKVYIIDEVHMLTTEAFNALLKTLEEPPSHAVFVLCTTEPHKVPETILSRCFRILFKRATKEELLRSFKRIVLSEKINIEDEALELIAGLSDGSFRDGTKILEEISVISKGKKITKELLEEKYKVLSTKKYIEEVLKSLEEKDAKRGLLIIGKIVKEGLEIKYFIEQMINSLHEELLIKVGALNGGSKTNFSTEDISELIRLMVRVNIDLRYSPMPQLPLEISLIEWSIKNNEEKVEENENNKHGKIILEKPKTNDFWQNLIEGVKQHNHSIAGVLRGCNLVSVDDKKIVIETSFKFHKEKLDEPKIREIIENTTEEIGNKKLVLSVNIKK